MNNKINEFIEELLPSDITPDKKENLKQELECHILEAIDFYEENGFSYEKKASYGAKFTYYTEKIEDHFYYYEIA